MSDSAFDARAFTADSLSFLANGSMSAHSSMASSTIVTASALRAALRRATATACFSPRHAA